MFAPKSVPFLKSWGPYTHIITAVISALITISLSAGSYKTKLDTVILDNVEMKVVMKELSVSLNTLSIQVAKLSQKMDDAASR